MVGAGVWTVRPGGDGAADRAVEDLQWAGSAVGVRSIVVRKGGEGGRGGRWADGTTARSLPAVEVGGGDWRAPKMRKMTYQRRNRGPHRSEWRTIKGGGRERLEIGGPRWHRR
jgi:hypothetical protein